MKTSLPTPFALAFAALQWHAVCGQHWKLRGAPHVDRSLENGDYAFIVSQISDTKDWCITAPEKAIDFANLSLMLCDLDGAPDTQLWRLEGDGKIHSARDTNMCMIVNYGSNLDDGTRVRLADCGKDTNLNKFAFDSNQLQVLEDEDFCVTFRGTDPDPNDTIHVKPCTNERRYSWTYVTKTPPTIFYYEQIVNDDGAPFGAGCIEVKDDDPSDDNTLVLGACNQQPGWRMDSDGLYHSGLDDGQCMQAGRSGAPKDGKMIRMFACDANNELQHFVYADQQDEPCVPKSSQDYCEQIKPKSNQELCVVSRGTTPDFGVDPIILKQCQNVRDRDDWSRD